MGDFGFGQRRRGDGERIETTFNLSLVAYSYKMDEVNYFDKRRNRKGNGEKLSLLPIAGCIACFLVTQGLGEDTRAGL